VASITTLAGAALRPSGREPNRLFDLSRTRRKLHTDIERHRDVDAQRLLKRHDRLGRELVFAAVEMRAKAHPGVAEDTARFEAEDLEAAAIGENIATPAHECV
jgi:hypothetical protein